MDKDELAERNRQNGKKRIGSGKYRHYKRALTIPDCQELCQVFPKYRKFLLKSCIGKTPLHAVLAHMEQSKYRFKRSLK